MPKISLSLKWVICYQNRTDRGNLTRNGLKCQSNQATWTTNCVHQLFYHSTMTTMEYSVGSGPKFKSMTSFLASWVISFVLECFRKQRRSQRYAKCARHAGPGPGEIRCEVEKNINKRNWWGPGKFFRTQDRGPIATPLYLGLSLEGEFPPRIPTLT